MAVWSGEQRVVAHNPWMLVFCVCPDSHKEMAPHKYMALEQRLRNDPRLAEYF